MHKFFCFLKMYSNVLCFSALLVFANSLPFNIITDDAGQQYYITPLVRSRRDTETKWDVSKGASGTTVGLGLEKAFLSKNGHELTGGGFVSKTFDPTGPATVGGSVGYHHVPSDTAIKAIVAKTPNWGTDVAIQGTRTLWAPDKNTKLEAYGGASQSFTPWGNTRPEGNVGIRFNHQNNWFSG